jgi:predicted aldo/keto reductase-like oxidoreductase
MNPTRAVLFSQEVAKVPNESSHQISRRGFVRQTGILAGGALCGAVWDDFESRPTAAATPTAGDAIPKRILGKTGVPLTVMTLGTAPCGFIKPHNPKHVAECVNAAIDLGINAIDTAPAYDVAQEGVGLALGKRRKQVFVSTKILTDEVPEAEKILSNSLKMLKTDYVDVLYFHQVGERKVDVCRNADGVFTWMLKQKKAGRIRFVGISIHNHPAKAIELLDSGEVDVLLTVINFVDRHTYHFEETVLPVARKRNVGIVAMKVFGGGKDMNYADPKCPPQLDTQYLELGVRYSLGVPGVTTLDIGCHNVDQIRRNVETVCKAQPLSPDETARVETLGKELSAGWKKERLGPVAGLSRGPIVIA